VFIDLKILKLEIKLKLVATIRIKRMSVFMIEVCKYSKVNKKAPSFDEAFY